MAGLISKGLELIDDYKNRDEVEQTKKSRKQDYLMVEVENLEEKEAAKQANKKKKDIYQLSLPKIPEYSALKIFNDSENLYSFLSMADGDFLATENFQRAFSQEEAKIMWQFERIEEFGDYILLFPNPDHKAVEEDAENGISHSDAMEYFEKIFYTNASFPFKRKFMDALREAFEYTFIELTEFVPRKESEKKEIQQKREEEQAKKQQEEKEYQNAMAKIQKKAGRNAAKTLTELAEKQKQKDEEQEGQLDPERVSLDDKSLEGQKPLESVKKAVKNPFLEAHKPPDLAKPPGKKDKPLENTADLQNESLDDKKPKAGEEDVKEEQKFQQQTTKQRYIYGGKNFEEPQSKSKEEDKKNPDLKISTEHYWLRIENAGGDFLTLLRKTVISVLANQGFVMREIFLDEGKQIGLILNLPEINVKKIAREMGLSRSIEFGMADLMSLEPLDSLGRPLRANSYLLDENLWGLTYCTANQTKKAKAKEAQKKMTVDKNVKLEGSMAPSMRLEADPSDPEKTKKVLELRHDILQLLQTDCNFKKFVRLAGGIWRESTDDYLNGIYNHAEPTLADWENYRKYLLNLSIRMNEIVVLRNKIKEVLDNHYNARQGDTDADGNGRSGPGIQASHNNQSRRMFDRMELQKFICKEVTNAFVDSISEFKGVLHNLWDRIGVPIPEYAFPYEFANNHMRPKNRFFYEAIWKDYFVSYDRAEENEEGLPELTDINLLTNQGFRQKLGLQSAGTSEINDTICHFKFSKTERLMVVDFLVEPPHLGEQSPQPHRIGQVLQKT